MLTLVPTAPMSSRLIRAYRPPYETFCDITSAELFNAVLVLAHFRFSNSFSISSPIFSDIGRGSSIYALMLLYMWSISR